jgi:phosphate transport system substrate-binding protein
MPKAKVEKDKQVTKFFTYGFGATGEKAAEKLEYIPLPDSVIKMVNDYWKTNGVQP